MTRGRPRKYPTGFSQRIAPGYSRPTARCAATVSRAGNGTLTDTQMTTKTQFAQYAYHCTECFAVMAKLTDKYNKEDAEKCCEKGAERVEIRTVRE